MSLVLLKKENEPGWGGLSRQEKIHFTAAGIIAGVITEKSPLTQEQWHFVYHVVPSSMKKLYQVARLKCGHYN